MDFVARFCDDSSAVAVSTQHSSWVLAPRCYCFAIIAALRHNTLFVPGNFDGSGTRARADKVCLPFDDDVDIPHSRSASASNVEDATEEYIRMK